MEMKKLDVRELVQKVGVWRLLLLVAAGVLLLVLSLPGSNKESGVKTKTSVASQEEIALEAMEKYARGKEEEAENILSEVEGVGKVKVMLTLSASEEKVPLQNNDVSEEEVKEQDRSGGSRDTSKYQTKKESILVQKEGEDTPYVVQIYSPAVEGVVVVAKGADSAKIQTEIIEAIQALFPVEVHKIKVMKME